MSRQWGALRLACALCAALMFSSVATAQTPSLSLEGGIIPPVGTGAVDVVLDNTLGNLTAFILAIGHDFQEATLMNVDVTNTDTVTADPEFISSEIQLSGGILTVIFDFEVPIDGHSLPPGEDLVLARYHYSCVNPPVDPEPAENFVVDFVDGVLGFPPIDNLLNVEGIQISPVTTAGVLSCQPLIAPNGTLRCGRMNMLTEQVDQNLAERVGSTFELSFYYSEPEDNIQGFEFSVEHDCRLIVDSTCLDTTGSALEANDAEFFNCIVDDDPLDDGCHFAVGVLMDALPPFGGQTLPPTDTAQLLGTITMTVDPTTLPGEVLSADFTPWTTVDVMFVVDGTIQPVPNLFGSEVTALPPLNILRGDCNNDGVADLADAIHVLNVIFFDGVMLGCHVACDHNDDGTFDVADYIFSINYFFLDGPPFPAPFPNCAALPGAECENEPNCP